MTGESNRLGDSGAVAATAEAATDDRLQDLLLKTSRTFALSIPLLPQPTLREVTVAYLLFRIADTLEDASVPWSRSRQLAALAEFGELMVDPSVAEAERLAAGWLAEPPTDHDGYLELLAETPRVVAAFLDLSPGAREAIGVHTRRTAERMAGFVEKSGDDGVLQLAAIPDLRAYCYAVAGIVGEMLTELFLLDRGSLEQIGGYLRERAALFGEGLQLVNILKDSSSDATEGRNYLPAGIDRAEVFALARGDLEAAAEYSLAVQRAGGPDGVVAFTALPVELARATLDRVERDGPGSKITRDEVFRIYAALERALAEKRPAIALRDG